MGKNIPRNIYMTTYTEMHTNLPQLNKSPNYENNFNMNRRNYIQLSRKRNASRITRKHSMANNQETKIDEQHQCATCNITYASKKDAFYQKNQHYANFHLIHITP